MATAPVASGGIDVNAIVSQLMTLEQRPLVLLANKEAGIQAKLSAIGSLKGALSTLQTAVQTLAKADTFAGRTASVTGDQLSATATSTAVEGRYAIEVTALARAQSLASSAFSGSTAVVGGGTLTFQRGTYLSGPNTFTAASSAPPVNVTIEASSTLEQVRDKINAAHAGVSATIVTDATGARLTITSTSTGADYGYRMTVTDLDGTHTDTSGLSQLAFDPTVAVGSGKNLTQTRAPVDAALIVNGLALTSSSNIVTGALQGVTLTLKKEAPGTTAELAIDRDKAAVTTAVNAFVKAYNDLSKSLAEAVKYDPASRRGGPLNGESAARSVQSQLRGLIGSAQSGAAIYATLSDVGVRFERDGTLKLDSGKLDAAMGANSARVRDLFTADTLTPSTTGIAKRLESLMTSMLGTNGPIQARTDGLNANLKTIGTQRERIDRRLEVTEQRLRREYGRLDALLAQMQGIGNSLASGLSQLPAPNALGRDR